jgi:protein phosphatase
LDVFGITDVGKVRDNNEDQFFISVLRRSMDVLGSSLDHTDDLVEGALSDAYLMVVADGVRGSMGGSFASTAAVRAVVEYMSRTTGLTFGLNVDMEEEFLGQLERAVRHSHGHLKAHFPSSSAGPATTLTMVTLIYPRAYVVHVGDSRGYYLRKGRLKQFTRDQTMAEMMVDEGVMSEEDAQSNKKLQNMLASAVGANAKPEIGIVDLYDDDVLLLCSDGLTKHVDDSRIAVMLGEGERAEDTARALVDTALDGGGRDNITVIVAKPRPL